MPARLKQRADFLAVGKGARVHCAPFSLQSRERSAEVAGSLADVPRIGFTITKKVGGAVVRNRVRRRLKEAVRVAPELPFVAQSDYVIVGRIESLKLSIVQLQQELAKALRKTGRASRSSQTVNASQTANHGLPSAPNAVNDGSKHPKRIENQ
ncbi:MAG: ribonuclease P protein component [Hyphomicrobiales bacterium]|nr:ribonuclease P protein component [Hyphomicrobiales bacterium]MDE2115469.1 ribonuclease P protein component [Hyphomicrobiales bacterium]